MERLEFLFEELSAVEQDELIFALERHPQREALREYFYQNVDEAQMDFRSEILNFMDWMGTPQGDGYWRAIWHRLRQQEGLEPAFDNVPVPPMAAPRRADLEVDIRLMAEQVGLYTSSSKKKSKKSDVECEEI